MRLIGDDHDFAPVGQHRVHVADRLGGELLDGGEDDAARGPGQHLAYVAARLGFARLLGQDPRRSEHLPEQLVVQVVAVDDECSTTPDGRSGLIRSAASRSRPVRATWSYDVRSGAVPPGARTAPARVA
jgi:hypothetical protein